ncbi:MAG: Fic family protein [Candidatus Uhrbacteria bacterium]
MFKLNKRQQLILQMVDQQGIVSAKELLETLKLDFDRISKPTILRDLDLMMRKGLLVRTGGGRSVRYQSMIKNPLLGFVDIKEYFQADTDERKVQEQFNWPVFDQLDDLFTKQESEHLNNLAKEYRDKISSLPEIILKKEFERLAIELSWKSSRIEGNTYSLLETEHLIKEHQESLGHDRAEAVMILNHKRALDYLRDNKSVFQKLSVSKIEDLHWLLLDGLGVSRKVRQVAVGIGGTKYSPPETEADVRRALELTCRTVNKIADPFAKALVTLSMLSYIQPFEDGNKRTSRLVTNAILMAYDLCPLSYRNVKPVEYKKAVLLFYEQNKLSYLKQLFIEQFEFAVKNYFGK